MMGHPGDAAIMPLAEQASKAGIKMMYQNVPCRGVAPSSAAAMSARSRQPQGTALGEEAIRRFGLKPATRPSCSAPSTSSRSATCAKATVPRRSKMPASIVIKLDARPESAADPNIADPGHHRRRAQPTPTSS